MKPLDQKRVNEWIRLYGLDHAKKLALDYQKKYDKFSQSDLNEKQNKRSSRNLRMAKKKSKLVKLRKNKKSERKKLWSNTIKGFARQLEANLPKSEVWFRSLYEKHFKHSDDRYNEVFRMVFIPDVINHEFKYIIEIDGGIHSDPVQVAKDKKKDKFYKHHGYFCFRLKAYDHKQYISLIKILAKIRKTELPESFSNFVLLFDPK